MSEDAVENRLDMDEVAWESPQYEWTWGDIKRMLEINGLKNPTTEQLEIGLDLFAYCWKLRIMHDSELISDMESYWNEFFNEES